MLSLNVKWNWAGFIFSWVWAWYRRAHLVSLFCLMLFVLLYFLEKPFGGDLVNCIRMALGFMMSLFFGAFGESVVPKKRGQIREEKDRKK